ncbi:HAD family hydrolase [uncultured Pseudokineococcus sp.]|uniref:HAD family hydrolase n=1 Tax=uncultured Pseudokineococcus sp. TaxID=1642928 RepID=UPI0026091E58|nr:HAD family hydrolase [uncultured Pseudokineococcus sp.]
MTTSEDPSTGAPPGTPAGPRPTGRVRLVASDLDGTLLGPGGLVSPRTLAMISACRAAGVHVVFVTGRPVVWVDPVVEQTGHTGTAICANGAVVYDAGQRQVLSATGLAPADVVEAVERLRRRLDGLAVALETLAGFRREPGYAVRYDGGRESEVGELAELLAPDPVVLKLLVRREVGTSEELLAVAREELAGLAHPTHSSPDSPLIEVSAVGVSKAAALAAHAAALGVAREDVVAFGDMPNDVEMLGWAGRGYAMTGGHPEAVAAAAATAPACADDGVARVVEGLLAG